jgi:hypothetical protein
MTRSWLWKRFAACPSADRVPVRVAVSICARTKVTTLRQSAVTPHVAGMSFTFREKEKTRSDLIDGTPAPGAGSWNARTLGRIALVGS